MAHSSKKTHHILLACTGSVASVKVPHLVAEIHNSAPVGASVEVRIAATENSLHFFMANDWPQLQSVKLYRDRNEWTDWQKMGDPVLHIELRRWADVLVIAPCDANTLAKLANGICDNLVTCVARAWPLRLANVSGRENLWKPVLFCPAMNTCMWEHPVTTRHLDTLNGFGYRQVPPIAKKLACGDEGMGAMADVKDIAQHIWSALLGPDTGQ